MADEPKARPFLLRWRTAVFASDLSPARKLTLLALCESANADGTSAYPSAATLAARTSQDEKTCRRALDSLDGTGWFTRKRRKGQSWRLWEYALSIPEGSGTESGPSDERIGHSVRSFEESIGHTVPKDRTLCPEGPGTVPDDLDPYLEQDQEKNIAIAILGEKQVSEARLLTGYRSSTWYFRQRLRTRYPEHKSKFDQVDADEGYF